MVCGQRPPSAPSIDVRAPRLDAVGEDTGSYRLGEARFSDAAAEIERLRLQAELTWGSELRTLREHGLRDDCELLEVGCGPGFVTAQLLRDLPSAVITALDVDEAMLQHAHSHVGQTSRVQFLLAPAAATGLEGGSFDVVLARFVLQHIPGVPEILAELRRVLRPAGRLIVEDADFAFSILFEPEPPLAAELVPAIIESQRLQGGDGLLGRKLPRLLREAGFADIAVDAVIAHSVVVGREQIRRIIPDQAVDHLERAGLISAELAAEARDYLARTASGEEEFEGMNSFLVVSGTA